jgi:methyl-accepting chemotaxis protein
VIPKWSLFSGAFERARLTQFTWLSTIRARLYLAFGFAAALTIVGSSISYYEFVRIGATTQKLVSRSLPTTVLSLQLAERASSLVSWAPRLMTAQDDAARFETSKRIDQQAQSFSTNIKSLKELGIWGSDAISKGRDDLLARLAVLNETVTHRLQISNERQALAASIRVTHDALLDALAPAIDDANFDMMAKTGQVQIVSLDALIETVRWLAEIESQANLLSGLLTEASLVDDTSRFQPLRDQINVASQKIGTNLSAIKNADQRNKVAEAYKQLASIGGDDGIIALRKYELDRQHDAQLAFETAQWDAAQLKQVVDELVQQQSRAAQDISERVDRQLYSGRLILIVISLVAITVAMLVAWLYVGRNIAARLGSLSAAMRRIADGELNVQIQDGGHDEIATMTRALLFFRQATAEVTFARQKESEEAKNLESRRRRVDSATHNFEGAISSVVQTLDRAAKALDSSAKSMADTASRNQQQARATAAASQEATANVESVAAGAEEIARSIEHIAERVANSADVASHAADQAQAITDAVEGLSASVSEISEFSKLIRNIADQTNLLALNATIEAARAGEAGRGFAVVAQEVKGLAAQAANATEQITRQISTIEATTSQSIQTMKSIATTILKLNALANDVASAVRDQDAVTQEIARNASAAAKGTQDVSSNIDVVSTTAAETGQVASTVLTAAAQLAEQSHLLRGEVERYLSQVRAA